jgi:hypothetical protein
MTTTKEPFLPLGGKSNGEMLHGNILARMRWPVQASRKLHPNMKAKKVRAKKPVAKMAPAKKAAAKKSI